MKIIKNKNLICILIILFLNLSMFIVGSGLINNEDTNSEIDNNLKTSSNGREGKIFSTITRSSQNHYINRKNPGLNDQPKINLQNYYISHARMIFEDIEAENYTKNIETEPSEVIINFEGDPMYIYQKFFVEINQYVNNLSIFIQDITFNQPYTDENSWEIAIVNCTNDIYQTPNSNEVDILGKLQVRHPEFIEAHWELFDFKNKGDGPIFLNTSETTSTIENGITKYWFAFRVKIPGADVGPKFLYFNPDGEDLSDRGEGDTFIFAESIGVENFTYNNVSAFTILNGTQVGAGNIDSFKEVDNDRFTVEASASTYKLIEEIQINLKNHSSGISFDDFRTQSLDTWNFTLFSVDIELSVNVSNSANIYDAGLLLYNYTSSEWFNLTAEEDTELNITTEDESIQIIKIDNPAIIQIVLQFVNETNNNSMLFRFDYNGTDTFSVSINKLSVNIGELFEVNDTVQPYDPEVSKKFLPIEVLVRNGTKIEPNLLALEINDNFYYEAQADTNNLTIEFDFSLLPDLNTSLWDVSIYDWIFLYPNPLVPEIQIRIASNVSIDSPQNLTVAALEVLDPEGNWFLVGNIDSFANETETFFVPHIPANETLNVLQIMNKSQQNSFKIRLRYVGTSGFEKFNVTIDEFTFVIKIRNIYSSDITSKIGFGLNSDTLLPEDIEMKNFGVDVTYVDNQTGLWDANVPGGIPFQGIFEFNVTSLWHAIKFNVSGTYEIYKFEIDIDFEDNIEVRYMTGTNYFSVEVTDGVGDPIKDLEITFELLDENGKVIDEDTAVSNSDGIAKGSLKFKKVGDGYKIKASYDKPGIYAEDEKKSKEFRIVDELTLVLDTFLLYLPFILATLAGITIFVATRHHKHKKLRRIWAEDTLVLDDLLKISYLLIIHKDAGVTIYNKQISMDLDSDLIGGFLTAISQFRSEIKKTGEESAIGKGFEMDYYDFKIVIYDGDFVRVALILDGTPSKTLEANQELFTDRFEKRFGALIGDFSGDLSPFGETDKLVDRIFEISLMYPLQLGKHWEFTKLNKLEQALVEVANQMQKERKFFFVSSLLSYGLAGRKATRDQIISTILNLKRRGIFVPVKME